MLDAERTWDIQKGDPSVVVAILDTGIAYEDFGPYRKAPDFGATVFVQGHDFINDDTHANDDNFHGTHVASTVAEATNNREGVAGLAFRCALMPVKVLDQNGDGSFFDVAEGIDFAAAQLQREGHQPQPGRRRQLQRPFAPAVDRAVRRGNHGGGGRGQRRPRHGQLPGRAAQRDRGGRRRRPQAEGALLELRAGAGPGGARRRQPARRHGDERRSRRAPGRHPPADPRSRLRGARASSTTSATSS